MPAHAPSPALARWLAERCLEVYQNPSLEIGNLACRIMLGETQYVVFQGSNDLRDWLGNAKLALVERTHLGRIYDGFADFSARFWAPLTAALSRDMPVVLAGHSLGGAMALILGARLKRAGWQVEARYTFGCPPVGDAGWQAANLDLDIPTFCFRHGCDAIPGLLVRGRHVECQIALGYAGERLKAPLKPSWWKPWQFWTLGKADHSMARYARALKSFEERETGGVQESPIH